MSHTPAQTAEERAAKLLEHLFDDFEGWPDWWLEDIAATIQAAEDAAYERAAENMRQLAIHLEHAMDTLTEAERTPAVIGAYVREWSLTPLKSQEP